MEGEREGEDAPGREKLCGDDVEGTVRVLPNEDVHHGGIMLCVGCGGGTS